MDFHPSKLKWWLVAGSAAALVVQLAPAQSPLVFSKPADDAAGKANAFITQPPPSRPKADFDILPGASRPVPLSPQQVQQWQKFLSSKRDWILMTPAEILGVPTPEKILGIPDPDDDPNLSPEERYLKRQDQQQAMSATNAVSSPDELSHNGSDPYRLQRPDDRTVRTGDRKDSRNGLEPQRFFGQLLDAAGNVKPATDQNQRADSPWASAFDLPAPPPKPDPEQAAEMDRFRALLGSAAQPEPSATPTRVLAPVTPVPDPNMEVLPQFNPSGNSFTPLQSSAGRPTGITPLPGVTGAYKKPDTKPKPLVQLPPWLSEEPQPFTPLQRKF